MILRAPQPDELRFIFAHWVASAKVDTTWHHAFGRHMCAGWNRMVEALARKDTVLVAVADDGLLDGFVCAEQPDVLHYVFVRKSARKAGVASALLYASLPSLSAVRYTHVPRDSALLAKVPRGWSFAPHLLLRGNHGNQDDGQAKAP